MNIKVYLDKRYKSKSNAFPVTIMILKDRKWSLIQTGVKVRQENYMQDNNLAIVKRDPNIKSLKRANRIIEETLNAVEKFVTENDTRHLTASAIKKAFLKGDTSTLNEFMTMRSDEMRKAGRSSYSDLWHYSKVFLDKAVGQVAFSEFSLKTIKRMELYHLSKNPDGINGLSAYLRTIRTAFYAYAKENRIRDFDNCWNNYQIRSKKTRKRSTTAEILKAFRDYKAEGTKRTAQLCYLLSFYLSGINLIDLAKLKVADVSGDRLQYNRTKIGEEIRLTIPEQAKEIFNQFAEGKSKDDYLLPIMKAGLSWQQNYTNYRNVRNNYNKHINSIFKAIGVVSVKKITFYSARHTWASIADSKGHQVTAISEGLGHTNLSTTQIYLDDLKDNVIDAVNKDVINLD